MRADRRAKFCSVLCSNRSKAGAKHPLYNGGLSYSTTERRWVIHCRDGSLMRFARAVMEAGIRRPLHSEEIVHHRNGDPSDDRIENLALTTRAEHIELHRADLQAAMR